MGYFAARYKFTLIGAIIPSITSQADASAGELADLTAKIRSSGVPAIFAETGTLGCDGSGHCRRQLAPRWSSCRPTTCPTTARIVRSW